jgi:hypothetical protein
LDKRNLIAEGLETELARTFLTVVAAANLAGGQGLNYRGLRSPPVAHRNTASSFKDPGVRRRALGKGAQIGFA